VSRDPPVTRCHTRRHGEDDPAHPLNVWHWFIDIDALIRQLDEFPSSERWVGGLADDAALRLSRSDEVANDH
jgi:hypothetical protein